MHGADTACKWLGESGGFWAQTFVLMVSAAAALLLLSSSSRGERQRATIDLVVQQRRDPELEAAKLLIRNLHENNTTNFAKFLEDRASREFMAILKVLNNYEFIAAAVRQGALDETLFKRMQYTVVLKAWEALRPFVFELRKQDKHVTLFQELQRMAEKWIEHPLKPDH